MRAKSLPLLVLLALTACEKNEPKPEATRKEPEAKVDAIDPDLAEAVAAASVSRPAGGGAPKQVEGGPPLDGVFAPGAADKELPRGGMPKITLGSEGAEPRQLLGPKAPTKLSGTIKISMDQDPRQPGAPILLNISIEPKKVEAGKDDKTVAPQPVVVRVTGAKIDAPSVPKEYDEKLAKLKGSKVEYTISPGGAGSGFRYESPKTAPDEFKDVIRSLSDSLSLLTMPFPDKPLGAGGFFMVTSRDDFSAVDFVTYRMVKVKEVTPAGVTLDVSTKRYAADRTFNFPGLPPDMDKTLGQFQSVSQGTIKYPLGALLATQGEVTSVLVAQLGKDPKQAVVLQFQTRAELDLK